MGCPIPKSSVLEHIDGEKYVVNTNTFLDYFLYTPFDLEKFLEVQILKKRLCEEIYNYPEIGFIDLTFHDKLLVGGNFLLVLFSVLLIFFLYAKSVLFIIKNYKKDKFFCFILSLTLLLSTIFWYLFILIFLKNNSF